MSSGQWEVVVKSKKNKTLLQNEKKSIKNNKNNVENSPKVEDILPLAQVKSLYFPKKNKENKKPQEKSKEKVSKKKPKKQEQKPVPKPKPKSIENALSLINVEELKSILELGKQRFSDARLVSLKDIAAYINIHTDVEGIDPVFTGKPENYPLNIVPNTLRQILETTLKEAGHEITQLFFDICLTSMANDMSKGTSVIGYKIFMQMIVFNNPSVVINSLPKSETVLRSYVCRQPVSLSIMWVFGLAGLKDFSAGLKIFQELILPMIEMKKYSQYVVSYLKRLVYQCSYGNLTHEQYLILLDILNGPKFNSTKELTKDMSLLSNQLKSKLLHKRSDGKLNLLFEPLFKRLNTIQNNEIQRDILNILIQCLLREPQKSINSWKQLYVKNISSSAFILTQINSSWNRINSQLNKTQFKELIKVFSTQNISLSQSKRKEEGLQEASKLCQALIEKMTITRAFPWKYLTFLLIVSTAGLFIFDTCKHGSFALSNAGRFFKNIGVWDYGEIILEQCRIYASHTKVWLEVNSPVYYASAKDFVLPYAELTRDMSIIFYNLSVDLKNYLVEKIPLVIAMIEKYAPGLVDKITYFSIYVWNTVSHYTFYYFNITRDYLATNVFVGQLSPENLQKATLEALNTTQIYAAQYYDWVYQKVQLFANSKVQ